MQMQTLLLVWVWVLLWLQKTFVFDLCIHGAISPPLSS
jgi:hypothetical protein